MIFPDINILVYAHRPDSVKHKIAAGWLIKTIESVSPFSLSSFVCSGFIRIVTNHRIFKEPTPVSEALLFVDDLLSLDNCMTVEPGPRHWEIFSKLLKDSNPTANLVSDAYLAAIAMEHGCELSTFDSDFRRFEGLKLTLLR